MTHPPASPVKAPPESCSSCPGSRYCAPLRCYCGHEKCPAFLSFVDMADVPLPAVPVKKSGKKKRTPNRQADAWANREEGSWIDQL